MTLGPVLDAALAAQEACDAIGLRACVIGGVSLQGETSLRTCSAEDLLVMKVFAGRDKDWADVTSILERQGNKLNLTLVRTELRPLLMAKETPELADELERRIARQLGAS